MLCENCGKNEVSGYIDETRNGLRRRVNLCSKCLLEKQKALFGVNMFSGFLNTPVKKDRCNSCKTDLMTIVNTLYVGCPDCYTELGNQLNPAIKNLQNAVSHVGSRPGESDPSGELRYLKEQLRLAVKEERYEDAAVIDRKIKALD